MFSLKWEDSQRILLVIAWHFFFLTLMNFKWPVLILLVNYSPVNTGADKNQTHSIKQKRCIYKTTNTPPLSLHKWEASSPAKLSRELQIASGGRLCSELLWFRYFFTVNQWVKQEWLTGFLQCTRIYNTHSK